MMRETAISLLWVCAFPRRNAIHTTTAVSSHAPGPIAVVEPTIGGSAPGQAVLLSPILRETATSLLWVCAFPRRNAIHTTTAVCSHAPLPIAVIYPTMGGSAPGRAMLLSPMLRGGATSLLWICAFRCHNAILLLLYQVCANMLLVFPLWELSHSIHLI